MFSYKVKTKGTHVEAICLQPSLLLNEKNKIKYKNSLNEFSTQRYKQIKKEKHMHVLVYEHNLCLFSS